MPSIGDMMFAMAEWLRGTPLVEFSLWISETALSLFIQTNFWIIPSFQTIHILAIAMTFSATLMMNLKVMGLVHPSRTVPQVVDRYMKWVMWGLLVLLISGSVLTIGEPIRELLNPAFWIKMVLVVIALLLTLRFAKRARAGGYEGDNSRTGPVLVIILWIAIMALGRWIAYVPV